MKNLKLQSKIENFYFLIIIFISSFLVFPLMTKAAFLYFSPSNAKYNVNDTFIEEIRIDLEENEKINVVEIYLKYPSDLLKVKDISFGNSLLTVIPEKSIINQKEGIIFFAGGIIGGYTGKILGDPDLSNLLAKIIFRAVSPGFAEIVFQNNSQVLLNDGFGTPTEISFKNSTIKIEPKQEFEPLKNEWEIELLKDEILPEPFKIEIQKDPALFNGQYFIVFSTTDKQTGLDYYEIAEKRGKETKNYNELEWKRGESPYLLKDQELKSYIYVKAVDKAGNERIEILSPQKRKPSLILIIIPLLPVLLVFYFWLKKLLISKKW